MRKRVMGIQGRSPRAHLNFHTSQNVGLGKLRLNLARDLLKEPSQVIAVLPLGASIYDVESQKLISIADAGQERVQSLLIELAAGRKLTPKGEWLVVILYHRQHVGIVAEIG